MADVKRFGIDVSVYQGKSFNWDNAKKEGVQFAILRGMISDGSGNYVDSCFVRNYNECKRLNIPCGIYCFSYATNKTEAKKEAEWLYENVLKGRKFELPIFYDVESERQKKAGKRNLTDAIKTWCETLEAKNYWVGVYSYIPYLKNYVYDDEIKCYAKWIAQYNSVCQYSGDYGIWQFGGTDNYIRSNKVAGVVCDQNYMYVDYPSKIKAAGKNGYTKPAATTTTTTTTTKPATTTKTASFKQNDIVTITKGAKYYNGGTIPSFIFNYKWNVKSVSGDRVLLGKSTTGVYNINSPVNAKYLKIYKAASTEKPAPSTKLYKVVIGDSYWKIAEKLFKNGSRYQEIQRLNNNKSLFPGDTIKVPVK